MNANAIPPADPAGPSFGIASIAHCLSGSLVESITGVDSRLHRP